MKANEPKEVRKKCKSLYLFRLLTPTNWSASVQTNQKQTQQPPKSIQEVENRKDSQKESHLLKSVIPHVTITVIFRQLNGSLVSQISIFY